MDENSDGYQDAGEPGIPNVQVNLYDATGTLVATTFTDAHGGYLFPNLAPGNYYVDVVESTLPAGMTQTPPSTCRASTSATRTSRPVLGTTAIPSAFPLVVRT